MVTLLPLVLVLVVFLQLPVAWAALTAQQIAHDLQAALSSGSDVVLTSDGTAYAAGNFTPRYNIVDAPTYIVAVKPILATDVQKVVGLPDYLAIQYFLSMGAVSVQYSINLNWWI